MPTSCSFYQARFRHVRTVCTKETTTLRQPDRAWFVRPPQEISAVSYISVITFLINGQSKGLRKQSRYLIATSRIYIYINIIDIHADTYRHIQTHTQILKSSDDGI